MTTSECNQVIIESSIGEFFNGLVGDAVDNQNLDASEESVCYLTNLLSHFANSDALFESTPEGPMIRPLALQYGEALEAPNGEMRNHALRRLGDLALFMSGIFSDSLNRQVVDVDYYIAMGKAAYGYLSASSRGHPRWLDFSDVFGELGTKFPLFVDILNEVGDRTTLRNSADVMRLYEIWQRTGSRYARRQLYQFGIHPVAGPATDRRH